MVARMPSGTYWLRSFIMDGQKIPTKSCTAEASPLLVIYTGQTCNFDDSWHFLRTRLLPSPCGFWHLCKVQQTSLAQLLLTVWCTVMTRAQDHMHLSTLKMCA